MKCDLCDNQATVHLIELQGGQKIEKHLCETHAVQENIAVKVQTPIDELLQKFVLKHSGGESAPATGDGVVFLGGDDQSLRAVDAKTGEVQWSSPLGYVIRSSATIVDRAVLIGSGPTLNALNRRDGSALWTHVTGGEVTADLAVVADMVIAASHDGYIYALGLAAPNVP